MPRKKKEETSTKPRKTSTKAPAAAKKASSSSAASKAPRARKTAEKTVKAAAPKSPRAPRASKKTSVAPVAASAPALRRLPRQGETQMVAFIRDPRCIFTYWEVTPESVEEVKRQLMEEYGKSSMVLRVLRANAHGEMELFQEILVKPGEMNRYVELAEASGSYQVEIAQKAPSGRLVVYARSNRVVTGLVPGNGSGPARGGDPQTEVPAAFLDYFDEDGEVVGTRVTPSGPISSAEAYRLDILRKKRDHYAASRLR